jgi:hypothetical protein
VVPGIDLPGKAASRNDCGAASDDRRCVHVLGMVARQPDGSRL